MTEFKGTHWADSGFSREYRDNIGSFILERERLLEVVRSFYRFFLEKDTANRVLDLGCGDGRVAEEILKIDKKVKVYLVDGSGDMLESAKSRLKGFKEITYVEAAFQDLLKEDTLPSGFDFIVSSLAIHHLDIDEKRRLFNYVYDHLAHGGFFVNVDTILAPSGALENWYLTLWREWAAKKRAETGSSFDIDGLIPRYKDDNLNHHDTLEDQLEALRSAGFRDVDCFYKYGVFAVFGGRK